MLLLVRKHSKFIIIIFSIIIVSFVTQEISLYFLSSKNKEEDKGEAIVVGSDIIKYYEYKSRFEKEKSFFVNIYGISPDSEIFTGRRETIAKEMAKEICLKKIADNLNFKICDGETIDLFDKSKQEEIRYSTYRKKDTLRAQEDFDKTMKEIAESKMLSKAFLETEQQRKDYRRENKVENLIDSLFFYTNLEGEVDFKNGRGIDFDIEYLYVLHDIKDDEINITDDMYQQYIEENCPNEYRAKEKYKIKYVTVNYELSEEDIKENEEKLSSIKDQFSKTLNNESFAKVHSSGVKKGDGNKYILEKVENDKLPERIKNVNDVKENDVFVEIAKTSGELNKIYKILKIAKENKKNKGDANKDTYDIAVIYKQPYISQKTKDKTFKIFEDKFKKVKTTSDLEKVAEQNVYVINEKEIVQSTNYISGIGNIRDIVVNINKACRDKFGKDLFVTKPIKQDMKCVFIVVSEHIPEGVQKVNDKIKKKIKPKILKEIKGEKLLKKLEDEGLLNLSFEELKQKSKDVKFNYIKGNETKSVHYCNTKLDGIGLVNLEEISLLDEGCYSQFFKAKNGVVMVLVKKIYSKDKNNKDYIKYYKNKKEKEKGGKIFDLLKNKYKIDIYINCIE